jgi:hypothetical protein
MREKIELLNTKDMENARFKVKYMKKKIMGL